MGYDATGARIDEKPAAVITGTCAVVLNDHGEVLVQRRSDNGYWGLPGGLLDVGESIEQCVIREVLEETGLQVTVDRLMGVYSDPMQHALMSYPDRVVQTVTVCFRCRRESGELAVSNESTELAYFRVDRLPANTLVVHRSVIADTLSGRPEPFVR